MLNRERDEILSLCWNGYYANLGTTYVDENRKTCKLFKSYSLYSSENVYYIIHILELIVVVLCERKEKI